MKKGRPPKPAALRRAQGNPGRRPIKEIIQPPNTPLGTAPDWLHEYAIAEWNRIAPALQAMGLAADADSGAFAVLCDSYARWRLATESIVEMFVMTAKGYPMTAPEITIANKYGELYRRMCNEFGLTPASRIGKQSEKPPAAGEKEDEEWLSGKGEDGKQGSQEARLQ